MSFYAARQPILNKDKTLFAYELLFRNSLENIFPNINDDQATAKLIEGLQFNLGLETLTKNSLAFINFTQHSLFEGYPFLLPNDKVVVEILETATPSKKLLNACIELKKKKYTIALDDYEHSKVWQHFFPYIDIIKLDYSLTSETQFQEILKAIAPFPNIKLLAEKIETYEEYQHAVDLGCEYFQGYFFSRPEVIRSISFSPAQISIIKLMAEINKATPDMNLVTSLFEEEVSLSFKLLRHLQSPLFKRRKDVDTIKQAVVILGNKELKRFISILFTAQFSKGKPQELTVMSLARARFCESMAENNMLKGIETSAFLIGLLSLIDALVDADIKELMDKLPLGPDIKNAIVERQGNSANLLHLCEMFEKGEWQQLDDYCQEIKIDPRKTAELYTLSIQWATERLESM
ncbi:EAL domain-containing protein [Paraglaciecola aquimarina]|uniref:EAL domain-containing protein n=1 Tax=Paraglaciecola aquimarina TaxID=1235557 RepID=A0ABU3SZT8_9ALTE|nr:HDOD domain-containing protein [Paraglaciecola aquimarina]MDU0355524.1 EAL domain-containing protein [Paraglaciecola aquimarina]